MEEEHRGVVRHHGGLERGRRQHHGGGPPRHGEPPRRGRQEAEEAQATAELGRPRLHINDGSALNAAQAGFASYPAPDAIITYVSAMSVRESAMRDR